MAQLAALVRVEGGGSAGGLVVSSRALVFIPEAVSQFLGITRAVLSPAAVVIVVRVINLVLRII